MIHSFRKVHRFAFLLLAILVPMLLVFSLGGPEYRNMASVPQAREQPPLELQFSAARAIQVGDLGFRLRISEGEPPWLELIPTIELVSPDVLVYQSKDGELEHAVLLGSLSGLEPQLFQLQADGGMLVFYSLGHAQILGSAPLNPLGENL